MWICVKSGFFSIVKKGGAGEYQIRARVKKDLQNLVKLCNWQGTEAGQIRTTSNSDYSFRIIINKEGLLALMERAVLDIDYPNFKDAIKNIPDQIPKLDIYHQIWALMLQLQPIRKNVSWDSQDKEWEQNYLAQPWDRDKFKD